MANMGYIISKRELKFLYITLAVFLAFFLLTFVTSIVISPPPRVNINQTVPLDAVLNASVLDQLSFEGEHKYYKLQLSASKTYIFEVEGFQDPSFVDDPNLAVRKLNGERIIFDDDETVSDDVRGTQFLKDSLKNALIFYRPPQSGEYILDVGSFRDKETGFYHLGINTVEDLAEGTIGDDVYVTAGTNSSKFLRYTLEKDKIYMFELYQDAFGPFTNPLLSVYDTKGRVLDENVHGVVVGEADGSLQIYSSLYARLIYESKKAQDVVVGYEVLLGAFSVNYTLKVREAMLRTPGTLSAKEVLTGSFLLGRGEAYYMELTAGSSYQFELSELDFNSFLYVAERDFSVADNLDFNNLLIYNAGINSGNITPGDNSTIPNVPITNVIQYYAEEDQNVVVGVDSFFDFEAGSFTLEAYELDAQIPTQFPTTPPPTAFAVANPNDVFETCDFDVEKITINGNCEEGVAYICRESFIPQVILDGRLNGTVLVNLTDVKNVCNCISLLCAELQGDGISEGLRYFQFVCYGTLAVGSILVLFVAISTILDLILYERLRGYNARLITFFYCTIFFVCVLIAQTLDISILSILNTISDASDKFEPVEKSQEYFYYNYYRLFFETASRSYYLNDEAKLALEGTDYERLLFLIIAKNVVFVVSTIFSELSFLDISLVWIEVSYSQKQLAKKSHRLLKYFKFFIRTLELFLVIYLTVFTFTLLSTSALSYSNSLAILSFILCLFLGTLYLVGRIKLSDSLRVAASTSVEIRDFSHRVKNTSTVVMISLFAVGLCQLYSAIKIQNFQDLVVANNDPLTIGVFLFLAFADILGHAYVFYYLVHLHRRAKNGFTSKSDYFSDTKLETSDKGETENQLKIDL